MAQPAPAFPSRWLSVSLLPRDFHAIALQAEAPKKIAVFLYYNGKGFASRYLGPVQADMSKGKRQ